MARTRHQASVHAWVHGVPNGDPALACHMFSARHSDCRTAPANDKRESMNAVMTNWAERNGRTRCKLQRSVSGANAKCVFTIHRPKDRRIFNAHGTSRHLANVCITACKREVSTKSFSHSKFREMSLRWPP